MNSARRVAGALALLAALAGAGGAWAAPLEIRGTRPDFTAVVPDGFAPLTRGVRAGASAFARPGTGGGPPVVVTLRALASTVANEPMTERDAREVVGSSTPGARVSLEHVAAMGGLALPVVIARMPGGEVTALANVPTVPRALQLTVSGGAADEPVVRATMRAVLGSVRARTNWLTPREVARKRAARAALLAGWALLGLYALAWLARFRTAGAMGTAPAARGLRVAWLALAGLALGAAAGLLASVPTGASAFEPLTPALVALVVLGNAAALARRR